MNTMAKLVVFGINFEGYDVLIKPVMDMNREVMIGWKVEPDERMRQW